jgi:hypothetical protein
VTVEAVELGRLQPGSPHSSTVRATNDVPVVVERSLEASPPAPVTGWTSALGAPADAARWLVPHGGSDGELDEWLMVLNTGDEPVELSIVALVGEALPVGLDEVEVAPGQRRVVRLSSVVARTPLPLLVEASGPVVVERVLYRTAPGAQDLSSVMAVPMAPPA